MKRRVVVTGLGMVSPIGHNVQSSWDNLINGVSGIEQVTIPGVDDNFSCRIAGTVKDFDAKPFYSAPKDARRFDPFMHYAVAAAHEAMQDSNLHITDENAGRIGVSIGSGIGGLGTIEANHLILNNSGPRKVSPFFIPASLINMPAGYISIQYGLKGPNISLVTACTTGTHSIGFAARMVEHGDADIMLAGGCESSITALGLSGFSAARALSTNNDNPQQASRPWDKDRDGFVMGEGGAVLVLEEYEHAKQRNATIYAEVLGFGMSGDAYHITSPAEDGSGGANSMTNALRDAGLKPEDIDHINAHATSTQVGDIVEMKAMKKVFAEHANNIAITGNKSMIGHLLGAAGAVEAIFTILAIKHQISPPTINLDNPDEGCDLDFTPNKAREVKINTALSNSFGFGGTNGSLIFGKI